MPLPLIGYARKISMLPTGIFIFFIILMLILGSSYIYGTYAQQMKDILYVYLFMYLIAFTMIPKPKKVVTITIGRGLGSFAIMFIATFIIMLTISPFMAAVLELSTIEAGIAFIATFGLMHAFIKAYIEEKVFRERLAPRIGGPASSILFGVFHFFVLVGFFGFTLPLFIAMAWLGFLGFIWFIIWKRTKDTMAATGSHMGYNTVVMGMAPAILGAAA